MKQRPAFFSAGSPGLGLGRKSRFAVLLIAVLLLSLLAAGCSRGTGARGWAAPSRVGGLLLVSTGKGKIDAVDALSREARWRFPNDWSHPERGADKLQGIYGVPVASRDGSVLFVGDYNGRLYAFRPSDYSASSSEKPVAASLKLGDHVIGGVALDASSDTLLVTAGSDVYAVSAADMTNRISNRDARVKVAKLFSTGEEIWGTPFLSGGKVFVTSLDGNLYAVDQLTGQEAWRFSGVRGLASTPVVAGNLMLVTGFDSKLYAVDAATGAAKWSFSAANWVWSRPALDAGRAYFGDFDGVVYAVDLSNGTQAWSVDLGKGIIRGAPAIADGVLVVGTDEGWLAGIDMSTQALRWEKKLDTALTADLVAGDGTVYISPKGCVGIVDRETKVYYAAVDPLTGELRTAEGVC